MWIIFGWNDNNPDKEIYRTRFELYDDWMSNITEPLYTFTISIFHQADVSFQGSYIIISLFFLSILSFYICKTCKYKSFVLALILISVYALIVVLFRMTYAITFVLIGMYFFIHSKFSTRIKSLIMAIFITLASLVHSMCIIYFLLFIPYFINKRNLKLCFFIYIPITFILIGFIEHSLLPSIMNKMNLDQKMDIFLGDTNNTQNKYIQYILASLRVISVIILPLGISYIADKTKSIKIAPKDKKIIDINWFSLFIIPLLYISHDLYRIMFILVIIDFCMASNYIRHRSILLYTIVCACNIGYWFIWRPYFENVFLAVFTSNLLYR